MNKVIVIGSILQDNDKRQNKRRVTVTAIVHEGDKEFAVWQAATRLARIRFDRIHTDGGVHSNGWSLVGNAGTL